MSTFIYPPDIFEQQMYKDYFTAYVAVNANTSNPSLNMIAGNNIAGWTIAKGADSNSTPLANIACNLHLTPNFDLIRGPAGLSKEVNIDTSNLLTTQRNIGLLSAMVIHATTRWGDSYWFKVQGAPEMEVLRPCTCVYIVPDHAPSVII